MTVRHLKMNNRKVEKEKKENLLNSINTRAFYFIPPITIEIL